MLLGTVIGHATATIKHASLEGCKLLIVQPLDIHRRALGDPILAVDSIGAGAGTNVVLNSDGKHARQLVGNPKSPVRYFVCGLIDQ